jgi:phage tail protein X
MEGFGEHLDAFRAEGGDLVDAMCFVWYIEGQA